MVPTLRGPNQFARMLMTAVLWVSRSPLWTTVVRESWSHFMTRSARISACHDSYQASWSGMTPFISFCKMKVTFLNPSTAAFSCEHEVVGVGVASLEQMPEPVSLMETPMGLRDRTGRC